MQLALSLAVIGLLAGCSGSTKAPAAPPADPPDPDPARASTVSVGVVDLKGYALACKADADCAVVKAQVCDDCACARSPIAATDKARFVRDAGAMACGEPEHSRQCGDCPAAKPACQAGSCIAR